MKASEKRFVVDSMLGKVAKWLRILGFDTEYESLRSQDQVDAYKRRGYVLITRSRRWCRQTRVVCIEANDPVPQLKEVISSVPIVVEDVRPLHRCIRCNELLQIIPRDRALGSVPDYVFETNTLFYTCPNCMKVYWPGTHTDHMMERLQDVLGRPNRANSK